MDVLITGGAGFLGAHLADLLLCAGHRVTVLDNLSSPPAVDRVRRLDKKHDPSGRLSFVFRDVRDEGEIARAVQGREAIFHAAGGAVEEAALLDPREDFSVRVSGTFNVLEAMRARAPQAHLVLASSAAVYGTAPVLHGSVTFAADERQAVKPDTPFASGLACAEKYGLAYGSAYGLKLTVLRLATVYSSDPESVAEVDCHLTRLVEAARTGASLSLAVDPRWPLDVIHVDDVCLAAAAAWSKPELSTSKIFNVGGGARVAPSIREMAGFLSLLGGRVSLVPPLSNGRPTFVLDNKRLRNELGWQPSTTWQEGLARLFGGSSLTDGCESVVDDTNPTGLVAWPRVEGQA